MRLDTSTWTGAEIGDRRQELIIRF